jgi:hypothetical protein
MAPPDESTTIPAIVLDPLCANVTAGIRTAIASAAVRTDLLNVISPAPGARD